jgi:hypothetical protein
MVDPRHERETRGFRSDPQERDPRVSPFIEAAAIDAECELRAEGADEHQLGYCHLLWERQRTILRERYGIDWRTPAQMNPDVFFD